MTAVPVLLFHGVHDGGDGWSVTPAQFSEYVRLVAASGRTPVTVAALSERLRSGASVEGLVAVSFDDGDASQLPAAVELAESGIPSTVYVTVDFLGNAGFLDDEGLRDLAAVPGIEIGSHSVRHVHLDVLSRVALREQVRQSRAALEDRIGAEVRGIAYPHGSHDRRVLAAVSGAGYESGAAVRNALSHDREHPLSISRLTVTRATPVVEVEAFLGGEGRLGETRPRLRTRGFRVYRKARHRLGR
ncbi:MAG: glycosyl transferase, family 2 [Frankiales bacterium]|nr:glycosyl transferase, family 2 [Frankiales bacterium]